MMHAGRDVLNLLPPTSLQYLPPLPYAQPSEAYRLKFEEQMRALHAPKVSTSTKHTMPSLVSTISMGRVPIELMWPLTLWLGQKQPGESAVPGGAIDERSEYAHGQQTETSDSKKALQLQGKSSVEQSGNRVCPYIGWTSERTKHMLDAQARGSKPLQSAVAVFTSAPAITPELVGIVGCNNGTLYLQGVSTK